MKIKGIPAVLILLAMLQSCSTQTPVSFNPATLKSDLKVDMNETAGQILQHYYELKDGLVATNAITAVKGAEAMKTSVSKFKAQLKEYAPADSLLYFTPPILARLKTSDSLILRLEQLLQSKKDDCEAMRVHFKPVSDLMYGLLKDIKATNIQAYHHYCPMAMNEKGAYWLSASPEIENPYFGQKMLTCGELVDTIK